MNEAARPATLSTRFASVPVPQVAMDFVGYGLASAAALACDYGLLLLLAGQGLHYLLAQTISFCAGMAVAYGLSARFVFAGRRNRSQASEVLGFVAVGLAGLILTQLLLALFVSVVGLELATAKVPTAGCVFLFNFAARRSLVFLGAHKAGR